MNSTRNPKVGEIYRAVDRYVADCFEKLFNRLAAEGRIAPEMDIPTLTHVFSLIADGMCMRRAVDPDFDAKTLVPAVMGLIGKLLNPIAEPATPQDANEKRKAEEPRR